MKQKDFKYIYGPVSSWRLGRSLGVDPIGTSGKICSFNCIYCQIGKTTKLSNKREVFVDTKKLIKEISLVPHKGIDYITFSGMGEPTLAKNLKTLIKKIQKIRKEKIAVITNSTLISKKSVRDDLLSADFVIAKLDAPNESIYSKINRPFGLIKLDGIVKGLKDFRKVFKKRLAIQIMFTVVNKDFAYELASLVNSINPDEVQINTPLRPSKTKPLSRPQIERISKVFVKICKDIRVVSVYKSAKKKVISISQPDTIRRRGKPF
ncbi:MAG: radical SAM protein [Candidatus Gygaella obscura]|nr:radical SAM protein [Candidatus Gygaella obscura]